jgi:acetamidase/formamidase
VAEWEVDAGAGVARLTAHASQLPGLALPLAPMLGCFGVAPAPGEAQLSATAGPHGGNMDYRGFVAGVTVQLPVFVEGALLFLGDGHALQSEGEIAGSGLEIPMRVMFTVGLRKGVPIAWPRGEAEDHIFTVANARPLEQAAQHATTEMLRWMTTELALDPLSAQLLMSQSVEYDVGKIVPSMSRTHSGFYVYDPAYTMVCKLPRSTLAQVIG